MCHVLIIEDEVLIAEYLAWIAEENGAVSTAIAVSASAALRCAGEHRPELIVSDVNLAPGWNGPDAVQQIRAEFGEIPVIFVTASPEQCTHCEYAEAIIEKPIQPERLAAAVQAITA